MKFVGHGANAVEEGNMVVIRCKAKHLVAARPHRQGTPVGGMEFGKSGILSIGGIKVKPPGLRCRKCGEWLVEYES